MLNFNCKMCKHMSKTKCFFCGKTRKDYKKSHPKVLEELGYYYGVYWSMCKYRMKTTNCAAVDKIVYYLWGDPCQRQIQELESWSTLVK